MSDEINKKNFKVINQELNNYFRFSNARKIKLNLIDKKSKGYEQLLNEQNIDESILKCMPEEYAKILRSIYIEKIELTDIGYCRASCYSKVKKAYSEFKRYREYLLRK
jgi:D-hexose-6-phosphate mutarotase